MSKSQIKVIKDHITIGSEFWEEMNEEQRKSIEDLEQQWAVLHGIYRTLEFIEVKYSQVHKIAIDIRKDLLPIEEMKLTNIQKEVRTNGALDILIKYID